MKRTCRFAWDVPPHGRVHCGLPWKHAGEHVSVETHAPAKFEPNREVPNGAPAPRWTFPNP